MTNDIIKFLVQLRKMDKAGISPRKIILLYGIMANPGINGKELGLKLGYPERSHIQRPINIMIRDGWIEDRRTHIAQASPGSLHVTPAGLALWKDIGPCDHLDTTG